jgi:hypothetical protein
MNPLCAARQLCSGSVLATLKKALSLVPQLSPKLDMIDTTCRVVGYASRKNEQLFLQAIDKGMYEMDKSDRMGLSPDDDDKLGFFGDDDNGDDSVVVVDVDLLMSILKDGVIAPVGYSYTGKLVFLCFGPVSKFYSPILSTGRLKNLSMGERKKEVSQIFTKYRKRKQRVSGLPG